MGLASALGAGTARQLPEFFRDDPGDGEKLPSGRCVLKNTGVCVCVCVCGSVLGLRSVDFCLLQPLFMPAGIIGSAAGSRTCGIERLIALSEVAEPCGRGGTLEPLLLARCSPR